ncbi:MAG: ribonuclease P protein component 1 [Thermoplasmata archaeon]|nr:ribonuclease P protein component 1 [Thermoplasmata archaeon]
MMTKKNIHKHELIGLPAEVVSASHNGYVGMKGLIVDETKNTLVLEVDNVEKVIPKQGTRFRFSTPEDIEVNGSTLLFRPQDRIKKAGR